jgi:hypothetical protein
MFRMVGDSHDVRAPALIVSFGDWVDAGGAGTSAARHIADGGDAVATFDSDALYDYRSHRPILDIVDGTPRSIAWPQMTLTRRRLPERDVLVLTGAEPDYRWNEFARDVVELAGDLGVTQHVSLGAIPAAVPHTAPTAVMMTASGSELLVGAPPIEGLLRVPAAAVSAVEWALAQNGTPAVGFWAQVPHYAGAYAAGAIALVRRVEDHLAVTIGAGALEQEAGAQAAALRQVFEGNAEASAYLQRLEGAASGGGASSESIAEEVERFLREQQSGEGGSSPFSP